MRWTAWMLAMFVAAHARGTAAAPSAAPQPLAALRDADFALVREVDGRRFWISKLRRVGRVKPKAVAELEDGVAFGQIEPRALPAELKPLVDAKVLVHPASASAEICPVALQTWGLFAEFDSDEESTDTKPKTTAARFREDSGADVHYAVDVTEATRTCAAPVWARLASLPAVPVFAVSELDHAELEKLRARVRKTAAYREAQTRYALEAKGRWDTHPDTSVSGWAAQVGETRFSIASLQHMDDCQSFNADVSLVFRDQRLLESELLSAFFPKLALDLNGDGMPEWLTDDQLIGWNGKALERILSVEPATYGCRC